MHSLVKTPDGKRTFDRPRRRWEDDIKMGLGEMCDKVVKWVSTAGFRVVHETVATRLTRSAALAGPNVSSYVILLST
jgi:hypothetical protein